MSFDQIAYFCNLHPLEVKAIADGDAAQGIKGLDPILTGQLTREQIEQAEADPEHSSSSSRSRKSACRSRRTRKGPRYTPVSRRQDRPNAILWLVRNHPELKDAQIMRLVGTTKSTIAAIRERTHWNATNLQPMDPVTLGLCSQIDLDLEVHRAAKEKPVDIEAQGATLLPASETTLQRQRAGAGREEAERRTQRRCRVRQAQAARRQSRVVAAASLDAATAKCCRVRRFPLAVLRTQEDARPFDDRLRRAQNVVHHLLDRVGRRRLNFHVDLLGLLDEGRIGDRHR